MELKDQVCSLELAKKLKELGEPQDSLWWWVDFHQGYAKGHCDYDEMLRWEIGDKNRAIHFSNAISAPTVAELGGRLPQFFMWEHSHMSQKNVFVFNTEKVRNGKEWFVDYQDLDGNSILHHLGHYKDKIQDKSEANARAKMRIYLLENKLIEEG